MPLSARCYCIRFGLCIRNYRTRIVNCLCGLLLSLHLRYTPANMDIMILRSLLRAASHTYSHHNTYLVFDNNTHHANRLIRACIYGCEQCHRAVHMVNLNASPAKFLTRIPPPFRMRLGGKLA
jgi:hypothetical protein